MGEYQKATDDRTELTEAEETITEQVTKSTKEVEKSEKLIEQLKNSQEKYEKKVAEIKFAIKEAEEHINRCQARRKKLQLLEIEDNDDLTLPEHTPEELDEADFNYLRSQVTKFEAHDQNRPNLRAMAEYRARNQVYNERVAEFNVVNDARNAKRDLRNDLIKRRQSEFMAGFDTITEKVKQMYQMITLGGDAELELVNTLAPFEDGVVFTVRPPKKSWKNIWNLSGGEKTLSSLALVFALHQYKLGCPLVFFNFSGERWQIAQIWFFMQITLSKSDLSSFSRKHLFSYAYTLP